MAVKAQNILTVVDLTDAYSVILSSDAVALNGSTSTLGTAQSLTVNVLAFRGSEQLDPTVGTPTCPTNVTASVGSLSNHVVPVTINFAAALAASGVVKIPVTVDDITIEKQFSFAIAFKGATGSAATVYELLVSHAAVVKSISGSFTPSAITLSAQSITGTGNPASYSGRFKIETTTNNSDWTAQYTSSANEASKSFSIPSGVVAIRCSLYKAGGTTTLLDQQTVPVVSDGATGGTGAQGDAACTVILSNESHTFAAGTSAAVATNITVNVIAYKGATQVAATIGTISGAVTGLTTTVQNNNSTTANFKVTVTTALTTKSGTLTIPVTVDGKSFTKTFSWSLALTGQTGEKGDKGDQGDGGLTLVIISSNGNIFKNTAIATTLTAHVYQAGVELTGTALSALGSIKWYKDGGSTAVATGATLTISAGDVSNKAIYEAKLEG